MKPKFPLSAYNLFFQVQRKRILEGIDHLGLPITMNNLRVVSQEHKAKPGKRLHRKTHGKIGFKELARIVADRWKKIDCDTKRVLKAAAAIEKEEYWIQLEKWTQSEEHTRSPKCKLEPCQIMVGHTNFVGTELQVQTQFEGVEGHACNHHPLSWSFEGLLGMEGFPFIHYKSPSQAQGPPDTGLSDVVECLSASTIPQPSVVSQNSIDSNFLTAMCLKSSQQGTPQEQKLPEPTYSCGMVSPPQCAVLQLLLPQHHVEDICTSTNPLMKHSSFAKLNINEEGLDMSNGCEDLFEPTPILETTSAYSQTMLTMPQLLHLNDYFFRESQFHFKPQDTNPFEPTPLREIDSPA